MPLSKVRGFNCLPRGCRLRCPGSLSDRPCVALLVQHIIIAPGDEMRPGGEISSFFGTMGELAMPSTMFSERVADVLFVDVSFCFDRFPMWSN